MSKFIWLIEISDVDNYLKNKALGFIIVDATGSADIESVSAIVWRKSIKLRSSTGLFSEGSLKNSSYPNFIGNLN